MMTFLMTMDRLKTLLDAYGAAPSRWPAEEREAAEAMIAASDDARAAFAEAARLDALLDQAAAPPPADRLGWRLRGIGPKAEPVALVARPRRAWAGNLARAAAVVFAIAGGIAIGIALPDHTAVKVVATNDAGTSVVDTDAVSLAGSYKDAEVQDGDTGIMLAGYNGDSTSLPLQ